MTDAPPNDAVPQESAAGPGPAQPHQLATQASHPRVAIAHDYLTQRGGAERVVLAMSRAFPDAPIHTTLYNPSTTFPEFVDKNIVVSPLNRIGVLRRYHRLALPLLPWASNCMTIDADVVG